MRLIIAGSRPPEEFYRTSPNGARVVANPRALARWMQDRKADLVEAYQRSGFEATLVISGRAPGIDELGEQMADYLGVPVKPMPADWVRYGKSAGMRRNAEMAKAGEGLLALWDGASPGTRDMIAQAKRAKLRIFVYDFELKTTLF